MAVPRNDLCAVQVEVLQDELDKLYCQQAIFKHTWRSAVVVSHRLCLMTLV